MKTPQAGLSQTKLSFELFVGLSLQRQNENARPDHQNPDPLAERRALVEEKKADVKK